LAGEVTVSGSLDGSGDWKAKGAKAASGVSGRLDDLGDRKAPGAPIGDRAERDSHDGSPVAANGEPLEPTVVAASSRGWRTWLIGLARHGQQRIADLGLALLLGFGSAVASLYLFSAIAGGVLQRDSQWLDDAALAWLHQFSSPVLDRVAAGFSTLGREGLVVSLVLILILLGRQRRWGGVVALLLTTAGAFVLNDIMKDLFQRTRPNPLEGLTPAQAFSFPSGHAMVSAAFCFFLAYLTWRLVRGWRRAAWMTALVLLVFLIGLSRMYLGVHYLTDVVAGYLAGFLWTDAVIIGGRLLGRRRAASRGPDVPDSPPP
jgi:membrane-associated phospholipid phosphatase